MKIILTVVGYLIIFFAALIYNEIIIFNFCGFNENTWSSIAHKANDEINGKYDSKDSFCFSEYKIGTINITEENEEDYVEMN